MGLYLDDETMAEIGRARERLENYRNKIQPYCGEEEIPNLAIEPPQTSRQWDGVKQLQAEVRGWRQKHAEMMTKLDKLSKKKRKSQYD